MLKRHVIDVVTGVINQAAAIYVSVVGGRVGRGDLDLLQQIRSRPLRDQLVEGVVDVDALACKVV
jgi:hypothetical protein